MSHRRNRSSYRSDDFIVACEDDALFATSSTSMLSGGGSNSGGNKRQRVEDALPEPGDQELSAIDCPWCQRGKLFVWSNAVMQSRGVGRPFPAYDVTGPVVCTYGKTCATSSLRSELMNNLMVTGGGGGLTIERLLWKISAAIHTHVSSCSSRCCHNDQQLRATTTIKVQQLRRALPRNQRQHLLEMTLPVCTGTRCNWL